MVLQTALYLDFRLGSFYGECFHDDRDLGDRRRGTGFITDLVPFKKTLLCPQIKDFMSCSNGADHIIDTGFPTANSSISEKLPVFQNVGVLRWSIGLDVRI